MSHIGRRCSDDIMQDIKEYMSMEGKFVRGI